MQNIIILPGGGDPANSIYRNVYDLIIDSVEKVGFSGKIYCLKWPGHCSYSDAYLTLETAVDTAMASIAANEKDDIVLLGRSFGCAVALKCIKMLPKQNNVKKIILWGPTPYWLLWEMFKRDLKTNAEKALKKGLRVNETYFPSVEPIESLIKDVNIPTIIATGSKDPYCTPNFLSYLGSIVKDNKNIIIKPIVEGATHEVTLNDGKEIVEQYENVLFGK
jgi:esterase/lipase